MEKQTIIELYNNFMILHKERIKTQWPSMPAYLNLLLPLRKILT
jgi:hypothetical protein